jgi:hypothetical protein
MSTAQNSVPILGPVAPNPSFRPRRQRANDAAARADAAARSAGADAVACAVAAIEAAFRPEFRLPNDLKVTVERAIRGGADSEASRYWYRPAWDALLRYGVHDAARAVEVLRWALIRERRIDHEMRRPESAITRAVREALLIARLMRRQRLDHLVRPILETLARTTVPGTTVHMSADMARLVMFGR